MKMESAFWDTGNRRNTSSRIPVGFLGEVSALSFNPEGKFLASYSYDFKLRYYDISTAKILERI